MCFYIRILRLAHAERVRLEFSSIRIKVDHVIYSRRVPVILWIVHFNLLVVSKVSKVSTWMGSGKFSVKNNFRNRTMM